MKITLPKDFLMRKDLPINLLIILISLVFGLSIHNRHSRQYLKLKDEISQETEKNGLLNEISPLPAKLANLKENFWKGDKEHPVTDIITGEFNKKLKEQEAEEIVLVDEKQESKEFYIVIPFRLSFISDYKKILNFLKFVENSQKILRVKQVSIKKITEGEEIDGKLKAEVLLNAYALKNE